MELILSVTQIPYYIYLTETKCLQSFLTTSKYDIKLPDAVIAATALYLDLPLLSFDQGFKQVLNLKLITWK
jgi:predicted nucleic acid-binding protein